MTKIFTEYHKTLKDKVETLESTISTLQSTISSLITRIEALEAYHSVEEVNNNEES